MTSHVKLWRDKLGLADYDTQIKEVRLQLAEQLKVFDCQLEQKVQLLQDLSDYLRRRGEIEGEYARSLDKLAERFSSKIKRKEPSGQSVARCWLVLLNQTRQESRDHSLLSESCSNTLPQHLSHCLEHTLRLTKRSRDICTQLQDALIKITTELQTDMKNYHQYHTEYLSAEGKLRDAARMEEKQKQSAAKKVERLIEKRQCKVQEIHLKCTKARNDYLLNLAAVNASMNKYYLQDISTILDCSDLGYHQSFSHVMRAYLSSRSRAQQDLSSGLQQLNSAVSELDQSQDRDTLMQANNNTFCMPLRFQYLPHEGDQLCEVNAESEMWCELRTRFQQLQSRLHQVTQASDEASGTLQLVRSSLLDSIDEDVFGPSPEVTSNQSQEGDSLNHKTNQTKRKANLQETENLYFMKVKDLFIANCQMVKLQAKHDLLQVAIQKAEAVDGTTSRVVSRRSIRQKKCHSGVKINQKLFTGDLLSYIQASGQPIPVVVESCIRFINLKGLHHEGIFRVSGSQLEVNTLRDAFEKGEDPLDETVCDIDSVASVLKLYFRGLEKPLFPEDSYTLLMECGQIEDETEKVAQIKSVVSSYPAPLLIVMRYLFAFLNHVSQYSDENMMQPYNLAVCFGPSLLRGPECGDAVALQQINALVKTIIIQHESIFPSQEQLPGPVYEKCMTLEPEDCEVTVEEPEVEAESPQGKDELEAVAMFDYSARSASELSFKQGERLLLHSKPSSDWWRGEVNGAKGLIPSKYISVSSVNGSQEQSKTEPDRRSSSGSQSEDLPNPDFSTCLKVFSDKAGTGGSQVHGGKVMLQLPSGQLIRPALSPGALRKPLDPQQRRATLEGASEDNSSIQVDKEVHRHMNTVFKELIMRQPGQDVPVSMSSPSLSTEVSSTSLSVSPTAQKKGGPGRRGKGLFRAQEQTD
ncbi:rho GTPase-activating protein 4a [Chanos chanos]|uniref:Rho GTPase-activating protein 4a n=1 Tax=Chanos chanos TaxID=29144 RepID=A0A6J2UXE1_CHACN|nr:rho GTPase-activating protein 4-like [Chanos chanos]